MRYLIIVLWVLFGSMSSAIAQVSIGIGLPSVNIGINLGGYPQLVQVPGYPVYYAPQLTSNYFFYDGLYWVYEGDNWYASSWYNGPWGRVGPQSVPLYMLRVPVRYYRQPPGYFRGWRADAPPRWGEHWGHEWSQQRRGWDRWDHASAPRPAPLPTYQRQYSGDRYPRGEQQRELHSQNYRYQPRDAVVRQHYQEHAAQRTPAPSQREQSEAPRQRSPGQQDTQRSSAPPPRPQGEPAAPHAQPAQRGGEANQRSAPTPAAPQQRGPAVQDQKQQPREGAGQREQPAPKSSQDNIPQGKGASKESRGQGQEKKDHEKGEERSQERNR